MLPILLFNDSVVQQVYLCITISIYHFLSFLSPGYGNVWGLNEIFRYDLPDEDPDFHVYFAGFSNPNPLGYWVIPMWSGKS